MRTKLGVAGVKCADFEQGLEGGVRLYQEKGRVK
jgi:hypothetical protein